MDSWILTIVEFTPIVVFVAPEWRIKYLDFECRYERDFGVFPIFDFVFLDW